MSDGRRKGDGGPGVPNQKGMVAACSVALATLVPVTLYQTGVLKRLPDLPGKLFDSERITASKVAHPLGVPDGVLGLASFGTTMGLILLSRRSRLAKTLLGGKLTMDVAVAGFNATRQVVSFGTLCSWCTGTAIAAGVTGFLGRKTIRESWGLAADSWSFVAEIAAVAKARTER